MTANNMAALYLITVAPSNRERIIFPLSGAAARYRSFRARPISPLTIRLSASGMPLSQWMSSGQVAIRDLNSTSGTFVNGERVTGARVLEPGDEVRFADVVTRFEAGSPEPAATASHSIPVADHPVVPTPPGILSASAPPDGEVPRRSLSGTLTPIR